MAIVVDTITGNYFLTGPLLWKIRIEIDDKIEPVLIAQTLDDSGFLCEIVKNGITI